MPHSRSDGGIILLTIKSLQTSRVTFAVFSSTVLRPRFSETQCVNARFTKVHHPTSKSKYVPFGQWWGRSTIAKDMTFDTQPLSCTLDAGAFPSSGKIQTSRQSRTAVSHFLSKFRVWRKSMIWKFRPQWMVRPMIQWSRAPLSAMVKDGFTHIT